mgnify:CR=1 FL=1
MKKIAVVIRKSPFNTLRNSEALRMSVGLTLAENSVSVFFVDDGVYILLLNQPEIIKSPVINKHIETLCLLNGKLIADEESLKERNLDNLKYKVAVMSSNEVFNMIEKSDVVICW